MSIKLKRMIASLLALVMVMSFSITTAYAAKTTDIKSKSTSEFGTLTGQEDYSGKILGRKEVAFSTTISKLSSTSINTKLYASVEIQDYKTGKSIGYDTAPVVTNQRSTSYYWQGHSDAANNNLISSFGTHEARRSGSAAVYTEIYGF